MDFQNVWPNHQTSILTDDTLLFFLFHMFLLERNHMWFLTNLFSSTISEQKKKRISFSDLSDSLPLLQRCNFWHSAGQPMLCRQTVSLATSQHWKHETNGSYVTHNKDTAWPINEHVKDMVNVSPCLWQITLPTKEWNNNKTISNRTLCQNLYDRLLLSWKKKTKQKHIHRAGVFHLRLSSEQFCFETKLQHSNISEKISGVPLSPIKNLQALDHCYGP